MRASIKLKKLTFFDFIGRGSKNIFSNFIHPILFRLILQTLIFCTLPAPLWINNLHDTGKEGRPWSQG